MKKKRKKLLKTIKQEKVRLEKNLETFLVGLPEKKGYEAYINLLQVLRDWKTEMDKPIEMDYSIITNLETSICAKLDSNRKISVGLALLFAFINNEIYDDRRTKNLKGLPDDLMNEITDFKVLLKKFLFSWWRRDPKSASSEGPYPIISDLNHKLQRYFILSKRSKKFLKYRWHLFTINMFLFSCFIIFSKIFIRINTKGLKAISYKIYLIIYHKFYILEIFLIKKGGILNKKQPKSRKNILCSITINYWNNCWNYYI